MGRSQAAVVGNSREGASVVRGVIVLTVLFALTPLVPSMRVFSGLEEYLPVHTAIEIFITAVCGMVFAVGWSAHSSVRVGNLSILATCFLGYALLTVGHLLSFSGMPVFVTPANQEKAILFGVAGRFIATVGLLWAALRPWKPFSSVHADRILLGCVLGFVFAVYIGVLYFQDSFPRTFVPGEGVTNLKLFVEIGINSALMFAAVMLWRVEAIRGRAWISGSAWCLGLGGMFYVAYGNPFDIYNQMGHFYVAISGALLYRGLTIGTIREPYERLQENERLLCEANEQLVRAHYDLEARVEERTRELSQEVVERQFAEDSLRTALIELERQSLDLKLAKETADRANHAKSDFLSSMSHELRTPLNAIIGFAQLLRTGRPGPLTEKQSAQIEHIVRGGNHLLELINEVLDLSRIEAGRLALSLEQVDVHPLLAECLALGRAYAQRNGCVINDWVVDFDRPVLTDYTRFKQVLLNLISNAVKYNRPQGSVSLRMTAGRPGFVRFTVTDTGYGISSHKQSGLFEPFNRLGAEATDVEGTGVGLTISKRLIQAMDGDIGFETVQGQGTTFWIEVPEARSVTYTPCSPAQLQETHFTLGLEGKVYRLLYIEDNPANIQLMRALVAEVPQLELTTCHTAELGMDLAVRLQPDVIVMDINLPGMDGITCMGRLGSMPETASIPVIALSANVEHSVIRKGLEAGFASYLLKPLDIQLFFSTLGDLLGTPGQNQEFNQKESGPSECQNETSS